MGSLGLFKLDDTFAGALREHALGMLISLPCEWHGCHAVLNCHEALAKHIHQHCKHARPKESVYLCKLPRCSAERHSNNAALWSHIQASHLYRTLLPCPFIDCKETVRQDGLTAHAVLMHHNECRLYDPAKPGRLDFLYPTMRPCPPPPLPLHPPLAGHVMMADLLPVSGAPKSPPQTTRGIKRKLSRLTVDVQAGSSSTLDTLEESDEEASVPLDNLEQNKAYRRGKGAPPAMSVQVSVEPVPVGTNERRFTLPGPPPSMARPVPEVVVPKSIHYDIIQAKVEEITKSGII